MKKKVLIGCVGQPGGIAMVHGLKRFTAAMIAAIMCVTMVPQYAFADETEWDDGSAAEKTLLVFGDSTSTGYGLPDFDSGNNFLNVRNNDLVTWKLPEAYRKGRISEDSHPWMLKKYIAEKEFGGDLSKVRLSSMCLAGMRTDELRAFLDNDYYEAMRKHELEETYVEGEGIGFLTDHIDEYVGSFKTSGAKIDGHEIRDLADVQEYTRNEVKSADVIVVDVCTNNFGTYLSKRLAGKMRTPGFESSFRLYNETIDDIEEIDDDVKAGVNKMKKVLLRLIGADENDYDDMAAELVNALIYCYACCITNFSHDIEMIRELNPDAKIIVVGLINSLQGVHVVVEGKEVDFGAIGDILFDSVSTYMRVLDKNSRNYYFADVSNGLETFVDDIAGAESLEEYESTEDGKYTMDSMLEGLADAYLDDVMPQGAEEKRARQLIFDSAKITKADMEQIIKGFGDMSQIRSEVEAYIRSGEKYPSEDTMAFINASMRFIFYHGIGQHPSKAGCIEKGGIIIKAYDKEVKSYFETMDRIRVKTEEIYDKILEISKRIVEAASGKDYEEILGELAPLIEELKAIGMAAYSLPEYEKTVDAYADVLNQLALDIAELKDKSDELGEYSGILAESIGKMQTDAEDLKKEIEAVSKKSTAVKYDLDKDGKEIDRLKEEIRKLEQSLSIAEFSLKKASIKKVKAGRKSVTVKWKKVPGASGYQISLKTGKKSIKKNVNGGNKLSGKISGLKTGRKYTVMVRAWKRVNGKKYCSMWSAAKRVIVR